MNPNEEIDLIKIARDGASFIRKRGLPMLLAGLVGMAIAAGYRSWRTVTYETKFTLFHEVATGEPLAPMIESMQRQLKQQRYDSLSAAFAVSSEVLSSIRSISLVVSPFEKTITQQEREPVVLAIETTRLDLLPDIQAGIIRAFQRNSFIQRRLSEKRNECEGALHVIAQEKKVIDSLKQLLLNNSEIKTSFDVAGVFYQSVILENQRHQYQIKLQRLDDWNPVVNLTNGAISDQPPWLPLLAKGFFAGAAIGFAFFLGRHMLANP